MVELFPTSFFESKHFLEGKSLNIVTYPFALFGPSKSPIWIVSWPPSHSGFKGNTGQMHLYFHGIFSAPRFVRLLYSFFVPSLDFVHSSLYPTKFAFFKYISTGDSSRDPFGGVSSCDPFGMVLGDLQRRDKTVTNGTWNWWLLKHIFFLRVLLNWWFLKQNQQFLRVFLVGFEDLLRYTGWAGAAILRDGRFFLGTTRDGHRMT